MLITIVCLRKIFCQKYTGVCILDIDREGFQNTILDVN